MTSQANSDLSTASNHTNPFLSGAVGEDKYTSQVPLPAAASGTNVATDDFTAGTTGSGTGVGGTGNSTSTTTGYSASSGIPSAQELRQRTEQARDNASATAQNVKENIPSNQQEARDAANNLAQQARANAPEAQRVFADHPQGHAGKLAPSESSIAPAQVPAGTESVTNILTGIGGAILSAPAAALEALSPKAAQATSDGVTLIQSKMPAVSLNDVASGAQNAAGTAYSRVPEGTADTLKGYVGAAVAKAQEVLPPALGGSKTAGNTGEGQTAKHPNELASEYGTAAQQSAASTAGSVQQSLANAAATAQAYVSQALGTAQAKASDASASVQQTASDASASVQQTAADLNQKASATATDASNRAGEVADDVSNRASATADNVSRTAQDYSSSAQQTAQDYASSARQTGSEYAGSAQQTAQDYSSSAQRAAQDYSSSARQTGSEYAGSAQQTAQDYTSAGPQTGSSYAGSAQDYSSFGRQTGSDYAGSAQYKIDELSSRDAGFGSTPAQRLQDDLSTVNQSSRSGVIPPGQAGEPASDISSFGSATVTNTGTTGTYEISNPTGENAIDRIGR